MEQFSRGDLVRLKSGSPNVTVVEVMEDRARLSLHGVEEIHPLTDIEAAVLDTPYFMTDIPETATLGDVIRELNAGRARLRASHLVPPIQWLDNPGSDIGAIAPSCMQ